jgi:hypothetical protein
VWGRDIAAVKILDHPAHSPDISPGDFHLFLHLKMHTTGQNFHEGEVTARLRAKVSEIFDTGIQNLAQIRNKYLNNCGDYVEI